MGDETPQAGKCYVFDFEQILSMIPDGTGDEYERPIELQRAFNADWSLWHTWSSSTGVPTRCEHHRSGANRSDPKMTPRDKRRERDPQADLQRYTYGPNWAVRPNPFPFKGFGKFEPCMTPTPEGSEELGGADQRSGTSNSNATKEKKQGKKNSVTSWFKSIKEKTLSIFGVGNKEKKDDNKKSNP